MDLSTFLGILATLTTIALGIGTVVYFVTKERQSAKQILGITAVAMAVILLVSVVVIQLPGPIRDRNGVGASPTATLSAHGTVTPTATRQAQSGTVFYQADWSNGVDGWTSSAQWSVSSGNLVSNGSEGPNHANTMDYVTLAPVHLDSTPDYAVEARIQLSQTLDSFNGCYFGIIARLSQPGSGYYNGVGPNQKAAGSASTAAIQLYTVNTTLASAAFDPGTSEHLFRVDLKGNSLKFFADNVLLTQTYNSTFTAGGQVGLQTYACQLTVRSFRVYAL